MIRYWISRTFRVAKKVTRLNTHSVPAAGKYYFYCKYRFPKNPESQRALKPPKSLVLSKERSKEHSKRPSKERPKEPPMEPYRET